MDFQPEAGPSRLGNATPPGSVKQEKSPQTAVRRKSWFGRRPTTADSTSSKPSSRRGSEAQAHDLENSGGRNQEDGFNEFMSSEKRRVSNAKKNGADQGTENGESFPMDQLSGASISRKTSQGTIRPRHDPGGTLTVTGDTTPQLPELPKTPPIHFNNDDLPQFSSTDLPDPPTQNSIEMPPPPIPNRSSSFTPSQLPSRPHTLHTDKSQPPLPDNRPLPPLPSSPSLDSAIPPIPRDILVTPSSPHDASHRRSPRAIPISKLFDDDESDTATIPPKKSGSRPSSRESDRSSGSRSRSFSKGRKAKEGRSRSQSRTIGLGLPGSGRRSRRSSEQDDPPPLPTKAISVSSPVSSLRPSSPAPRVNFVDPAPKSAPLDGDFTPEEIAKRVRVRRARSLSGILGKTPSPAETPKSANGSRPVTPMLDAANRQLEEKPADEIIVKASGVLGWFGVKKTVKRRGSEGTLQSRRSSEKVSGEFGEKSPLSEGFSDSITGRDKRKGGSKVSLGLDRETAGEDLQISPTTELHLVSSANTVVPSSQSRFSNFFNRKPSAASTQEDRPETPTIHGSPIIRPSEARPIPNARQRPCTAGSSTSSVQFSGIESTNQSMRDSDIWDGTPTDVEETLTSPEASIHWGPGIRPWMDGMEVVKSPRSSISGSGHLAMLPEKQALQQDQLSVETARPMLRTRSYSDAPPHAHSAAADQSESAQRDQQDHVSRSLQPSPIGNIRPKMPGRANSGNAALIDRMKNAFASKSMTRGRSNTVGSQDSSDLDDFGGYKSRSDWLGGSARMRPPSSASSVNSTRSRRGILSRDRSNTGGAVDDQRGTGERKLVFLNETPEQSPRPSFTAASVNSATSSTTRRSTGLTSSSSLSRTGRARASTLSAAPTSSSSLSRPLSPNFFPVAATPPRRRPSAISRISYGFLGSGNSSPKSSSLFPLPPRSSGSGSSALTNTRGNSEDLESTSASSIASPRPSAGSIAAVTASASLKPFINREGEESVSDYLYRVTSSVGRGDIATVLASSGDDFHTEALKEYMSRFDFKHAALDIALRKLLLRMSLPKETQQIDRIIEAFSVRYEECEPGLFVTKDNTYILAFSMIMLHTDHFNKNNKNKMTKADYVKNTRLNGIPPLVLEAFYDNITYTPFIYNDDDSQPFGSFSLDTASFPSTPISTGPSTPSGGAFLATPRSSARFDVYRAIATDSLHSQRIDVESLVPAKTPFSAHGTSAAIHPDKLHAAFTNARSIEVVPPKRKTSTAGLLGSTPTKSTPAEPPTILKVTKVGLLSRKDEGMESGKKSSRKWKSWSVVLTSSQLLFFKDSVWALSLMEQLERAAIEKVPPHQVLSRMNNFKPDEVFPVKDCIAIYDQDYTAYPNTFKYVLPSGRTYLMQAGDQSESNEWIQLINYASAFKTAGVRIREKSSSQRENPQVELHNQAAYHGNSPVNDPQTSRSPPITTSDSHSGVDHSTGENKESGSVFADAQVKALKLQLESLGAKAAARDNTIKSEMRTVRNIAILTPFSRSTADRLSATLPSIADRVRQDRMHLCKFKSWAETLEKELNHEKAPIDERAAKADSTSTDTNSHVGESVPTLALSSADHPQVIPISSSTTPVTPGRRTSKAGNLSRSPGELPIIIRRPSGDDERLSRNPSRPGSSGSRQQSVDSYSKLSRGSNSPNKLQKRPQYGRATSDFLSATSTPSHSQPPSPDRSQAPSPRDIRRDDGESGTSTPMFNLSDTEDLGEDRNKL